MFGPMRRLDLFMRPSQTTTPLENAAVGGRLYQRYCFSGEEVESLNVVVHTQEIIASLLPVECLPTRADFEAYRPHVAWFLNPRQASKSHHDLGHAVRVLVLQEFLARVLLYTGGEICLDQEAIRWAAVTHDTQRRHDYEVLDNQAHGIRAAD